MTQVQADAALSRQLEEAEGSVQLVDEKGTILAVCSPVRVPHSPFSREELERRRAEARKNPSLGKPLVEILAALDQVGEPE